MKNVIERALLESGGAQIRPQHLHVLERLPETVVGQTNLHWPNFERDELEQIKQALQQTRGNITAAARLLGVNRSRIYRLMHKHQLLSGS